MIYKPITDQSIMERLKGSRKWIKASVGKMLKIEKIPKIETRRIYLVDATNVR
jgi:hypothetical protein